MFSKSFPDVKSPQQMAFEVKANNLAQNDEIDLDDLSPVEFITSDEESMDNENFTEILDELDFLGRDTEMKIHKRSLGENKNEKKRKTEKLTNERKKCEIQKNEKENSYDKRRHQQQKEAINSMDEMERRGIGALFRSIKEMRKAAKLNLSALTRLQELAAKYPSLDFMYKVMKPVSEIMPDTQINSLKPILEIVGLEPTTGGQKYSTESVVKIIPKRFVKAGRIHHRCSLVNCKFERVSWGAVNTHIMKDHVHKSYVCHVCGKVLTSMDGLRGHMKTQHGTGNK